VEPRAQPTAPAGTGRRARRRARRRAQQGARPRRTRLTAGVLACGAAALLAGGAGLLGIGPAWADSGSGGAGTTSAGGDTSSGAAPGGNLGGYNLSSSAAGISVDYEQPNFPIPANPTLEFDLGYSTASYDSGPVGSANASALWPGPVVAGGGSQLPLLIDPYLQQYAGPLAPTLEPLVPNFGNWPIEAPSAYPQGPTTASNDNGPTAMNSSTDQSGSTASASLAIVGGPSGQSALPAGMLTVQSVASTSQDTIDSLGNAVSEASSTVHGIDIAGGLIHIGAVSSTASSSSDGNNATVSGSSTVTGVTVAGQAVTVSANGISVAGNNQNLLGSLLPSVNQVLETAGITMALTNPTDTVSGASGQRLLRGLAVTINLSTFDQDLSQLEAELPSQLTSGLSQLPVPTPYKQVVTLDFAWAQVDAAASPPFTLSLGGTSTGSGTGEEASALGSSPTGALSGGVGGLPQAAGTTTPSATGSGAVPTFVANTTPALFKGIGTGLIILGLVLAAIVVGLLLGMDRAVGRLAAAVPCVGEDTGDLG
jgi:hypothetical protein